MGNHYPELMRHAGLLIALVFALACLVRPSVFYALSTGAFWAPVTAVACVHDDHQVADPCPLAFNTLSPTIKCQPGIMPVPADAPECGKDAPVAHLIEHESAFEVAYRAFKPPRAAA